MTSYEGCPDLHAYKRIETFHSWRHWFRLMGRMRCITCGRIVTEGGQWAA